MPSSQGKAGARKPGQTGRQFPPLLVAGRHGRRTAPFVLQPNKPHPRLRPPHPPRRKDSAHPDENPSGKPHTIRTNVELVNVPVTAMNKRGQPVIDLNMEDFQVFEDGVEQKITHFDRETSTPLRIGLILDTSNTARRQLSYEKEAASEFVFLVLRNGGTKNQVFLQTFDASSSIIQDFTNDPDLLNEKIQDLKSGGGKALYDAIYFACREKMRKTGPPEEMRRILIVLSDGLDVQSQHTLDQAVSMARMTETMIYTVGTAAYGFTNPGDKLLEDISTETGGYAVFPLARNPGHRHGDGLPFPRTDRGHFPKQRLGGGDGKVFRGAIDAPGGRAASHRPRFGRTIHAWLSADARCPGRNLPDH